MVQAFSSDRANQPFHVTVLPGRMRSRQNFLNVHAANCRPESISVTTISISNQKTWSLIPGERFQHLLRHPFRSGMSRNVEMDDSSAMMLKHNKHEQETKAQRGNYEEIDRVELLGMIFQECPPRLGRRLAVSRNVFGNRSFLNFDFKYQQFSVDSRCTPDRIRYAHFTNQIANRGGDFRSAGAVFALPCPTTGESPSGASRSQFQV